MSTTHEMRLVNTLASGAEEWLCPSCRRRILMQWPPRYELVVLERGDETVTHTGGKGGLSIVRTEVSTEPTVPQPLAMSSEPIPEDSRWLREIGIVWDDEAGPDSGSAA
ncbi:hypothetical protein [Streptomyces sp. GbtcB6]|uniref:hypothetical protein n=1 Tax=Streptomyces sp. GbtcB6 TaxID=2824751 RepID=UPI001C302C5F|nr:hypothetical protein [Streptomyces sp. GbtcB6]